MNARRALVVVVVVVVVGTLAAGGAWAQFAPGPLSKAHADVDGMGNCTKCHGEGARHDNSRCLECHTEIARRKSSGEGYHARLGAQLCAECHREHRGAAASIIEWPSSQRAFNHSMTSWPLVGQHRKADCKKCHEPRRMVDDDARKLLAKGRDTFLGLPSRCAGCHFDEHRSDNHGGRPGEACAKCHTPEGFKPAKLFDHNNKTMASYPLTGLHKKVDCAKCHAAVVDDKTAAAAFPAPKSRSYAQLSALDHNSCTDCHDDAHRGAFGRNCTQCHTTAGWRTILQSADDFGFHDKTKFPLRGEHTSVACKTCHGPFPGQKAIFKGLPHARCADCHVDAHVGQIAKDDKGEVPCERCHTVNGFVPVLFDAAAHARTRFPLEGAHQAVACNACHTADDKLARKVPAVVRAKVERQKRRLLLSDARIDLPDLKALGEGEGAPTRCESCHDDPHGGQFDARIKDKGCNACHQAVSFTAERFNHDDSRFALTGKHKAVACSRCHVEEAAKKKSKSAPLVRYRPVALACATCHNDEHVGQLAKGGVTECTRCHQPTGFKPSTFRHDDPAQTTFILEGKHKDVLCVKCHVAVAVAGVDAAGQTTSRFKPVPSDCAACHDDEHEGRFDRFVP
ncbi:MAG: cytochrome c3 family protein [Deltaproteobacteria bacterium]|nr:cytochrome c3 family protein [Deltaproteobacteria bacterium]